MEIQNKIHITTETYEEQQYVLARFPDALWLALTDTCTHFFIDVEHYDEAWEAMKEWALLEIKALERKKK